MGGKWKINQKKRAHSTGISSSSPKKVWLHRGLFGFVSSTVLSKLLVLNGVGQKYRSLGVSQPFDLQVSTGVRS